jgi:hypothetical protein
MIARGLKIAGKCSHSGTTVSWKWMAYILHSLDFAQLMDFLPRHEFNKCAKRYQVYYRINNFSCRDHFLYLHLLNCLTAKVSATWKPVCGLCNCAACSFYID